jgi:hypothetical protein
MERKIFQIIQRKEISQKLQFPRGISVSETQSHNKTLLSPIIHPQGGALRTTKDCTLELITQILSVSYILVCILKHTLLQCSILHLCTGSQTFVISRYIHPLQCTSLRMATGVVEQCNRHTVDKILLYGYVNLLVSLQYIISWMHGIELCITVFFDILSVRGHNVCFCSGSILL